ncbi:HelD family protein [Georgenia alba]|uniref:HelD family protein n=1 Tax=Georgenia alba TaxID=2233858 RepID=A0ABW2Q453_9MICO
MSELELQAESRHHDRVRDVLGDMRRATVQRLGMFEADYNEGTKNRGKGDVGPDHHLGYSMARRGVERLEQLADRDVPMFFGRLWFTSGSDYHLGRIHVADERDRSRPLVVDWRAPLAGRFYRASVHAPLEVTRRRRFGFQGSVLTGFEDEDLSAGEESGSELLAAEIERPRTGPMRDIVATIQPEQDELIRRDLDTTVCVQGAPGTGKTAVGLHRAAWLLYTYTQRLERSGMLVVGPNENFLRYIADVLPTLGEMAVWQVTVDRLTGAADAPGRDAPEAALIKHDARMVQVCERAVWSHLGHIDEPLVAPYEGIRWTLDVEDITHAVDRARAGTRTWEDGRKSLQRAVLDRLARQRETRIRQPADGRWVTAMKRHPVVKLFFDAAWPRLTANQVLRRLATDAAFRREVCRGVLSGDESELLRSIRTGAKASPADVLLLDEVQGHLTSLEPDKTYGHIVVDEAQDLSPMQCRAIARRSAAGSLTVLGDLAQGTTPWAAEDWGSQMRHLGHEEAEHTDLTIGYRVPGAIIDVANRVLPHLGVAVAPARSLRSEGSVDVVRCDDVVTAAADAVEEALAAEGLVGVIAPAGVLGAVRSVVPANERVELVPSGLAKGLEFDHVVLVEPAEVVAAFADGAEVPGAGLRHLYVALTRAVSRLTVVHAKPLPTEMTGADLPSPTRA